MFPTDKKGERHRDPSSPKIAVYSAHPTSKPTVKVSEVNPAPGSAIRSRIKLLQDQKKLPNGGWTSSSIHNPSSQDYLRSTLPQSIGHESIVPLGVTHAGPAPQPGAHVFHQQNRSREENLAEQVQVLETQVNHYKGLMGHNQQNVAPYQPSVVHGNHAGQYPATALPPGDGPYAPQPLAYDSAPHLRSAPQQQHGPVPTAPGPHQATLGYPHGTRPPSHEQPYVGATARFSKLASEPSKVPAKRATKQTPPEAMPAVETHNTALLEQLQHQQRVADAETHRLHGDLAHREAQRTQIEQELLHLRKHAAESHAQAQKCRAELDDLLSRRYQEQNANQEIAAKSDNLKQRYDFVCEELALAKRELEAERKIPKYQPPSATQAGFVYGTDPYGVANDFSSTALACDNESLKSQLSELRESLQQRDQHIEYLSKTNASLMEENAQLSNDVRHEQQKHLVSLSTTESHRVLLGDAQSEVEYLRLITAEQKGTIDRMAKDHEERFERIKTEMEARQVRELQAQHATEGAKSLHVEASRVHKALLAEQAVNESLRLEIASLQRRLDEELHKNRQQAERYDRMRNDIQKVESTYAGQTANLESMLAQWQQQQARQASEERGQLQHATDILKTLKALELPYKSGQLEGPPRSAFSPQPPQLPTQVMGDPWASTVAVSGTLQLSRPGSPIGAVAATVTQVSRQEPRICSLQNDVKEVLQMEEQYRRDAEASRREALVALAMHNKSLDTPMTR